MVTPFAQGTVKSFSTLLCDGYLVEGVISTRRLTDLVRALASDHPGCRLLTTLDDLGQASYTSGHSIDANDLDALEGHNLALLDPAALKDGEHLGYLSTKSEFPIRARNLAAAAHATAFSDLKHRLDWLSTDAPNPVALNDPTTTILDVEIHIQIVPVATSFEALAAYPNGYFHGDLSPMDVFALARRLEERHGLCLFGVGASYIGFMAEMPITYDAALAVVTDVMSIYRNVPDTAAAALAKRLVENGYLLVRYVDR